MNRFAVECLSCGRLRMIESGPRRLLHSGECPRCRYLGWAPASDLTEEARRRLRDRPPDARRRVA